MTLIAESDYAELDEERLARGHEISPEGNAHQSELSPDNRFLVGTDEDFNAYRVVAEITSGPNSGTEFTAISGSGVPPIDADTNISGTPTFVGLACPTSPPPAGDGIALIERGVCSFQEKLDTVKAAGYDAGIVFNTVRPDCQGLVFMLAAGDIPFVFVTRATGLQLLNQTLSADVCTQASPAVGSPVASAAGRRGPRRPRRPRVGRVGPLGAARARARARAGRAGLGVAAAWTPRRAAVRTRRGTWAPNAWRVAPPATTAIHRSSRCRWPRRPPRRLPGTSAVSRRLSVSRARLSGLEIRRAPLLRLPATTLRFRRVDMQNVRDLPDLWPYRQRRHLVVACLDDVRSLEALRSQIEGLGGILIVEREPGPLSGRLGRPSVTVADRFGTVGLTAKEIPPERILAELEAFELSCPECGPQAWGDPGA